MRQTQPRVMGFKNPFTSNALGLVQEVEWNGRRYFIYKLARKPDEYIEGSTSNK